MFKLETYKDDLNITIKDYIEQKEYEKLYELVGVDAPDFELMERGEFNDNGIMFIIVNTTVIRSSMGGIRSSIDSYRYYYPTTDDVHTNMHVDCVMDFEDFTCALLVLDASILKSNISSISVFKNLQYLKDSTNFSKLHYFIPNYCRDNIICIISTESDEIIGKN